MMQFQSEYVKNRFPLYFRVGNCFRYRRVQYFLKEFCVSGNEKILDVGGEPYFWEQIDRVKNITILNLHKVIGNEKIKSCQYDGGRFPFSDGEYDIVFSNSTIEHVGGFLDQKLFAREIQRVGKRYFVQVPSYWFPYEPHAHILFFQFFSSPIKIVLRKLYPKSTYAIEDLLNVRLLTKSELKILFPNTRIITERCAFLPKSYYVVK